MKNPNSWINRTIAFLTARWSLEDYPGGEPHFKLGLFAKDVAIFVLLPTVSIFTYRSCERANQPVKRINGSQSQTRDCSRSEASKSQIIEFRGTGQRSGATVGRRSPGSLVKVRLLNVVETYTNAPVHAQIVDEGLGHTLMGGTLIGDATPDSTFERISINFKYARDPNREAVAFPISARALSLDGTLGLTATKKEGFFTRAALGSASGASQSAQPKSNSVDLKDILFQAMAAGFMQEFNSGTQVEKSRSQVLTLQPDTEFLAELTDFFPGGGK